jgi:hypothetical protein
MEASINKALFQFCMLAAYADHQVTNDPEMANAHQMATGCSETADLQVTTVQQVAGVH